MPKRPPRPSDNKRHLYATKRLPTHASTVTTSDDRSSPYLVRVRMYRHGLGDCLLLTFPRPNQEPFQLLMDCGALNRDKATMTHLVQSIRDTVRHDARSKARLDVVVATHEHKDHVSGFNQARQIFNEDIDIGSVWLAWTENLSEPEIRKVKESRRRTLVKLQTAVAQATASLNTDALQRATGLLEFNRDDDITGTGKVSDALEYLKLRGKKAGDLRYLLPGSRPLMLPGVDDVRVYVMGPPRDPAMLKASEITDEMVQQGVVYYLRHAGEAGVDALCSALADPETLDHERFHPFSREHRVIRRQREASSSGKVASKAPRNAIASFIEDIYDAPELAWRQIDTDWLSAFDQLALDLDNDTNNTSLILAFEFMQTGKVLLFVGDAQIGSWQSLARLEFKLPNSDQSVAASDLLQRTVFYKVGHHGSRNATLAKGGLELMQSDELVAFIPIDKPTAKKQGKNGWDMPAQPLFARLNEKAGKRVVLSDLSTPIPSEAERAGIVATERYIDYYLVK